jgi:hypothetical protein
MFVITKRIANTSFFLKKDFSITEKINEAKKCNNQKEAKDFLQSSRWQKLSPNEWKIVKIV